ncbi:helix-turn-helix domain-containing protein [Aeromonas veronii]|uniref:helix-turn-helix domain-containing protein n=1 Tax=Aeromonas veronii TaxID=654 RepID=UPI003BA02DDF
MNINFLDRPIAFHRPFVAITGSVTAALFLSQALYWAKRCKEHEDGCSWFYKTQADWEEETGLTRYEQEGARKALRNLGVLKEKRVGLPAQLYFSIDLVALEAALNACDFLQPSMRKTSKQARGKPAISSAENPLSITEITTETTTEIQDPPLVPQGNTRPESSALRRGTRLPNDWFLPAEWGRWASQETGWPRERILLEAATFADYWQSLPGAKATKLDWEKTWRNWVRRAASSFRTAAQRKPLANLQAAQNAAQALRESGRGVYDDNTPL